MKCVTTVVCNIFFLKLDIHHWTNDLLKNNEQYHIDFVDSEKGPFLFKEKGWGFIDSEKYCDKIVPFIDEMASMKPWLSVMQDNASAHTYNNTMEVMRERSMIPTDWPPNSSDLNSIKAN